MNGDLICARPSLRLARLKLGFSQTALANMVGLTQSRVCHIERGLMIGRPTAETIAKALGSEIGDLFPEYGPRKLKRREAKMP